jgi:hypothetical protein
MFFVQKFDGILSVNEGMKIMVCLIKQITSEGTSHRARIFHPHPGMFPMAVVSCFTPGSSSDKELPLFQCAFSHTEKSSNLEFYDKLTKSIMLHQYVIYS